MKRNKEEKKAIQILLVEVIYKPGSNSLTSMDGYRRNQACLQSDARVEPRWGTL